MSTFSKDKSSINSVEKSSHRILMIIGIILVIVTSPIIFSIPAELNQGNQAIWFTLVFPLTGFGILWGGWLIRKKYTFFGPTPLQLSPAIGQLGGQIGGQINLNQPWGSRKITVRLSCIHTYTTGSGDNSSSHNDILWQRETQAYI
ncbi:MAG: hypothetical protein HRU20_17755 [Pseudomonadales bacterium]|nr:hypothetical protein [Pseudomonadales bacterium]